MSMLNKKVASLIEGSMPCGACEQCLVKSIDSFFRSKCGAERQFSIKHMSDVANAVAKERGTHKTAIYIAQTLTEGADVPFVEAMMYAGKILGFDKTVVVINSADEAEAT